LSFTHQYVVIGEQWSFVVDFLLTEHNVVVEIDAPNHHNRNRAKPRDRHVDMLLAERGIRVVRIVDDGDADAITQRILAAL
jgi:very-short-patch-repair endonuclease